MVVTNLLDSSKYSGIHPLFARAFDFLSQLKPDALEVGRIEIEGDSLFALVSEYQGKSPMEAKPEAHRTYIDIQYVISGEEHILWMPLTDAKEVDVAYDESSDILFFKDRPICDVALRSGQMAILFPEDIHAPAISDGRVFKVILKIKL